MKSYLMYYLYKLYQIKRADRQTGHRWPHWWTIIFINKYWPCYSFILALVSPSSSFQNFSYWIQWFYSSMWWHLYDMDKGYFTLACTLIIVVVYLLQLFIFYTYIYPAYLYEFSLTVVEIHMHIYSFKNLLFLNTSFW